MGLENGKCLSIACQWSLANESSLLAWRSCKLHVCNCVHISGDTINSPEMILAPRGPGIDVRQAGKAGETFSLPGGPRSFQTTGTWHHIGILRARELNANAGAQKSSHSSGGILTANQSFLGRAAYLIRARREVVSSTSKPSRVCR